MKTQYKRRGIQLATDIKNIQAFPEPKSPQTKLPLSTITVDDSIQMREAMNRALIAEYAESVDQWIASAPLVVFADDTGNHILADGFHRIEAARQAGLESVPVIVKNGTRADALRFAIGANHGHGARRTTGDLERAYRTAVREEFCSPDDAAAVAALLHCSERHARTLTQEARDRAKQDRDAEIARLAGEGKSNREIAAAVGVDEKTVRNLASAEKRQTAESPHPAPEPELPPVIEPPSAAESARALLACLPESDKLEVIVTAAPEAARAASKRPDVKFTGNNEWHTPAAYLDAARAVMGGIDLDPASNAIAQATVRAARFFTLEDDGLARPWHGRVWLNPPYSHPEIQQFTDKVIGEWEAGRIDAALVLTHAFTSSSWFHRMAAVCRAICLTNIRIAFGGANSETAAPRQGQAFFYLGNDLPRFAETFGQFGLIVLPHRIAAPEAAA